MSDKPKLSRKKRKNDSTKQKLGDANLELALAMSASLGQSKGLHVPEVIKPEPLNTVLLKPPASVKPKVSKSKNPLENYPSLLTSNTEEETERLILRRVENVLVPLPENQLLLRKKSFKLGLRVRYSLTFEAKEQKFWVKTSQSETATSQKANSKKNLRIDQDQCFNMKTTQNEVNIMRSDSGINKLSSDWDEFFTTRSNLGDISVYLMDEEILKVHKLILQVRCPSLLTELIVESGENGREAILSWGDISYADAHTFFRYLYSGQLKVSEENTKALAHILRKYHFPVDESLFEECNNSDEIETVTENGKLDITFASERKSPKKVNGTEKSNGIENHNKSNESFELDFTLSKSPEKNEGGSSPIKSNHVSFNGSDEDLFSESQPNLEKSVPCMKTPVKSSPGVSDDFPSSAIKLPSSPHEAKTPEKSSPEIPDERIPPSPFDKEKSPEKQKRKLSNKSTPSPKKKKSRLMTMTTTTPEPDFDRMTTPAIAKEIKKFGLKKIAKDKAVALLKHIYEETHPYVDDVEGVNDDVESLSSSPQKSRSELYDFPEETSILENGVALSGSPSKAKPGGWEQKKFRSKVDKLILTDPVYRKMMYLYQPIPLEEFIQKLNEDAKDKKEKMKPNEVMDFLDAACVTFTTKESRTKRRK